jgi:drug/metabolite transporter (DMT)-like permease
MKRQTFHCLTYEAIRSPCPVCCSADLWSLPFTVVDGGSVALITYNRAVSLLGAAAATAVIALLPAVASILAILVLGETPSPAEGVSIVVIALGVLLASGPTPARRASIVSQT